MKDFKTTFFFLRLPIAISLLGHGLVRIPKLATFSDWMLSTMEKSALPALLIQRFAYALPITEAVIGLSLLVGFKTKQSIYAGLTLMSILILGSCSIENWTAIEAQLLHAAYLFGLLWFWQQNHNDTKSTS